VLLRGQFFLADKTVFRGQISAVRGERDFRSRFFSSSLACDGVSSSNDEGRTKCTFIGQEIASFLTQK